MAAQATSGGAIAVAAALVLPLGFPQRALLQEITFGIVPVTVLAQGATAGVIVRAALRQREPRSHLA